MGVVAPTLGRGVGSLKLGPPATLEATSCGMDRRKSTRFSAIVIFASARRGSAAGKAHLSSRGAPANRDPKTWTRMWLAARRHLVQRQQRHAHLRCLWQLPEAAAASRHLEYKRRQDAATDSGSLPRTGLGARIRSGSRRPSFAYAGRSPRLASWALSKRVGCLIEWTPPI